MCVQNKTTTMGIHETATVDESEYLPADFCFTAQEDLKPYYQELLQRPILSVAELWRWLCDRGHLSSEVSEYFARCFLAVSRDTENEEARAVYQEAVSELLPFITEQDNLLDRRLLECPYADEIEEGSILLYLRNLRNQLNIYREANTPLRTETQLCAKQHSELFAGMDIQVEDERITLQRAGAMLEIPDRIQRESVYHKINHRILSDAGELENIFDKLLAKRQQMALNAGFDNYRDFRFAEMNRFDYSAADCRDFHTAVRKEFVPLLDQTYRYRKASLRLDRLRPWDLHTDPEGRPPLQPFRNIEELVERAAACLDRLDPDFGTILRKMNAAGNLDLDARPGKRPGGYNMPLLASGMPFIFMNATCSIADMRTLLHESGHALHSYLSKDREPAFTRRVPPEAAELAAMSMELLSMEHWDIFFPDPQEWKRARLHQLEMILKVLPWVATIDAYQHWLYTHPGHDRDTRRKAWLDTFHRYRAPIVDHEGLEEYTAHLWHKQLHLFEVPFYYIEYGIAQLGALAVWRAYREDPAGTMRRYRSALELGYSCSVPEIYAEMGIPFDFSPAYVGELARFVKAELDSLLIED